MQFWELLIIAGALSMDAFAVSVCMGLGISAGGAMSHKQLLRTSVTAGGYFGVFQGIMPLLGWLLATWFAGSVAAFDHWIAFGLLAFIGGKMIWEAIKTLRNGSDGEVVTSLEFRQMLPLALATSIDAMAMGVTFALERVNIGWAVLMIGIITAVLSAVGVLLGRLAGEKLQGRAEIIGGVVLVGMGIKMLVEGLMD